METSDPKDLPKPSIQPKDQDPTLEFPDKKKNDICTAHQGPTEKADGGDEILHVHAPARDDGTR